MPMQMTAIVRLLAGIGIADGVAPAVAKRGEFLRRRMIGGGGSTELASAFDAVTGRSLGRILAGTGVEIDVSAYFAAMKSARGYIIMHTHPGGAPPSIQDVVTFYEERALTHSLIVGADGTWYALARAAQEARLTPYDARLLIAVAYARWRPQFEAAVRSRQLSRQEARAALLDKLWRSLGPALGLGYDTSR